jgi:hypothetical protein
MPWISDDCHKKLAIVGICKNAGKTTLLNSIIKHFNCHWGVMSTGHDGEVSDLLFKTPKPRVVLSKGSLFCADTSCMDAHGNAITILNKTPWLSGGKALWIARAEQSLETEIGGPQNVTDQIACAEQLLLLGADKALIDGSLDRKSIALSDALDAIILSVGASFGDLEAILTEIERLFKLCELSTFMASTKRAKQLLLESKEIMLKRNTRWVSTGLSSLIGHEKQLLAILDNEPQPSHIYIPGAYTSSLHKRLGKALRAIQIIFRHPESIKLSLAELEAFTESHQAQCLIPFKIQAIAINSQGFGSPAIDADAFRGKLRSKFPTLELIDIMETD